jgi:mRNA degradation ribonuclease J1/J2
VFKRPVIKCFSKTFNRSLSGFSLKRTVSVLTLFCFLYSSVFSQLALAAFESAGETNKLSSVKSDFLIPYTSGRITDAKYYDSDTMVINIQDLHCHPEVQKNISNILSLLDAKYKLTNIYVEGAIGQVDTSWLTSIKDNNLKNEIVGSLLSEGRLTGPEYFSVMSGNPKALKGIENGQLFKDNIVRLNRILNEQPAIQNILSDMKGHVDTLKNTYYVARHQDLEKLMEKFKTGDLTAEEYYQKLVHFSDGLGIDIGDYRHFSAFVELMSLQGSLDLNKVNKEIVKYISLLKEKLPFTAYRLLSEKMNDPELNLYLLKFSKQYNIPVPENLPQAARFLDYVALRQNVNPIEFIREENMLINDLHVRLSKSEDEKEIVFLISFFKQFSDYYSNKISAEEYESFTKDIERFNLLWKKHIDTKSLSAFAPYEKLFNDFYSTNIQRNDCFISTMFGQPAGSRGNSSVFTSPYPDQIAKTTETLKDAKKIVVVVTGGFHTHGLSKLLSERHISYMVITPNVTGNTTFSEAVYVKIARIQAGIIGQSLALLVLSQNPESYKCKIMAELALTALSRNIGKPADALKQLQNIFTGGGEENEMIRKSLIEQTAIQLAHEKQIELGKARHLILNAVPKFSFNENTSIITISFPGQTTLAKLIYDKTAKTITFTDRETTVEAFNKEYPQYSHNRKEGLFFNIKRYTNLSLRFAPMYELPIILGALVSQQAKDELLSSHRSNWLQKIARGFGFFSIQAVNNIVTRITNSDAALNRALVLTHALYNILFSWAPLTSLSFTVAVDINDLTTTKQDLRTLLGSLPSMKSHKRLINEYITSIRNERLVAEFDSIDDLGKRTNLPAPVLEDLRKILRLPESGQKIGTGEAQEPGKIEAPSEESRKSAAELEAEQAKIEFLKSLGVEPSSDLLGMSLEGELVPTVIKLRQYGLKITKKRILSLAADIKTEYTNEVLETIKELSSGSEGNKAIERLKIHYMMQPDLFNKVTENGKLLGEHVSAIIPKRGNVSITYYGGDEIGCGGIWINAKNGEKTSSLMLDPGINMGREGQLFDVKYMRDKSAWGIKDRLLLGLMPRIKGLWRDDLTEKDMKIAKKEPPAAGILISHAHVDHAGNLAFVRPDMPVYVGPELWATLRTLDNSGADIKKEFFEYQNRETGLMQRRDIRVYEYDKPFKVGDFEVIAVRVDHSESGAAAFFVNTPEGWVVWTGDLRMNRGRDKDGNLYSYQHLTEKFIAKAKKFGIKALLIEGTAFNSSHVRNTEDDVANKADEITKKAKTNLVIANFAYTNLERMAGFLAAAKNNGRKLVISAKEAYLLEMRKESHQRMFIKQSGFDSLYDVIARGDVVARMIDYSGGRQALRDDIFAGIILQMQTFQSYLLKDLLQEFEKQATPETAALLSKVLGYPNGKININGNSIPENRLEYLLSRDKTDKDALEARRQFVDWLEKITTKGEMKQLLQGFTDTYISGGERKNLDADSLRKYSADTAQLMDDACKAIAETDVDNLNEKMKTFDVSNYGVPDLYKEDGLLVYQTRKKSGTYLNSDYRRFERLLFNDKEIKKRSIRKELDKDNKIVLAVQDENEVSRTVPRSKLIICLNTFEISEMRGISERTEDTYLINSQCTPFNLEMKMSEEAMEEWLKRENIPGERLKRFDIHASGHLMDDQLLEAIHQINPNNLFIVHSQGRKEMAAAMIDSDSAPKAQISIPLYGKEYQLLEHDTAYQALPQHVLNSLSEDCRKDLKLFTKEELTDILYDLGKIKSKDDIEEDILACLKAAKKRARVFTPEGRRDSTDPADVKDKLGELKRYYLAQLVRLRVQEAMGTISKEDAAKAKADLTKKVTKFLLKSISWQDFLIELTDKIKQHSTGSAVSPRKEARKILKAIEEKNSSVILFRSAADPVPPLLFMMAFKKGTEKEFAQLGAEIIFRNVCNFFEDLDGEPLPQLFGGSLEKAVKIMSKKEELFAQEDVEYVKNALDGMVVYIGDRDISKRFIEKAAAALSELSIIAKPLGDNAGEIVLGLPAGRPAAPKMSLAEPPLVIVGPGPTQEIKDIKSVLIEVETLLRLGSKILFRVDKYNEENVLNLKVELVNYLREIYPLKIPEYMLGNMIFENEGKYYDLNYTYTDGPAHDNTVLLNGKEIQFDEQLRSLIKRIESQEIDKTHKNQGFFKTNTQLLKNSGVADKYSTLTKERQLSLKFELIKEYNLDPNLVTNYGLRALQAGIAKVKGYGKPVTTENFNKPGETLSEEFCGEVLDLLSSGSEKDWIRLKELFKLQPSLFMSITGGGKLVAHRKDFLPEKMGGITFYNRTDRISGNIIELRDGESKMFLDMGSATRNNDEFFTGWGGFKVVDKVEGSAAVGLLPWLPDMLRKDMFNGESKGIIPIESAKVKAVLLTHAHLDHIESLYAIDPDVLIICSEETRAALESYEWIQSDVKSEYTQVGDRTDMTLKRYPRLPRNIITYRANEPFELEGTPFKITPIRVGHSIPTDAFVIQTSMGKIVYTGDLTIQSHDAAGTKRFLDIIAHDTDIRMLVTEGINVRAEQRGNIKTEQIYMEKVDQIIKDSQHKPVFTSFSWSYLNRLKSYYLLAKANNRKLVIPLKVLYFAMKLRELGYDLPDLFSDPDVLVHVPQRKFSNKTARFVFDLFGKMTDMMGSKVKRTDKPAPKIYGRLPEERMVSSEWMSEPANAEQVIMVLSLSQLNEFNIMKPAADSPFIYSAGVPFSDGLKQLNAKIKLWTDMSLLNWHDLYVSPHIDEYDLIQGLKPVESKYVLPIHTERSWRFKQLLPFKQILQPKPFKEYSLSKNEEKERLTDIRISGLEDQYQEFVHTMTDADFVTMLRDLPALKTADAFSSDIAGLLNDLATREKRILPQNFIRAMFNYYMGQMLRLKLKEKHFLADNQDLALECQALLTTTLNAVLDYYKKSKKAFDLDNFAAMILGDFSSAGKFLKDADIFFVTGIGGNMNVTILSRLVSEAMYSITGGTIGLDSEEQVWDNKLQFVHDRTNSPLSVKGLLAKQSNNFPHYASSGNAELVGGFVDTLKAQDLITPANGIPAETPSAGLTKIFEHIKDKLSKSSKNLLSSLKDSNSAVRLLNSLSAVKTNEDMQSELSKYIQTGTENSAKIPNSAEDYYQAQLLRLEIAHLYHIQNDADIMSQLDTLNEVCFGPGAEYPKESAELRKNLKPVNLDSSAQPIEELVEKTWENKDSELNSAKDKINKIIKKAVKDYSLIVITQHHFVFPIDTDSFVYSAVTYKRLLEEAKKQDRKVKLISDPQKAKNDGALYICIMPISLNNLGFTDEDKKKLDIPEIEGKRALFVGDVNLGNAIPYKRNGAYGFDTIVSQDHHKWPDEFIGKLSEYSDDKTLYLNTHILLNNKAADAYASGAFQADLMDTDKGGWYEMMKQLALVGDQYYPVFPKTMKGVKIDEVRYISDILSLLGPRLGELKTDRNEQVKVLMKVVKTMAESKNLKALKTNLNVTLQDELGKDFVEYCDKVIAEVERSIKTFLASREKIVFYKIDLPGVLQVAVHKMANDRLNDRKKFGDRVLAHYQITKDGDVNLCIARGENNNDINVADPCINGPEGVNWGGGHKNRAGFGTGVGKQEAIAKIYQWWGADKNPQKVLDFVKANIEKQMQKIQKGEPAKTGAITWINDIPGRPDIIEQRLSDSLRQAGKDPIIVFEKLSPDDLALYRQVAKGELSPSRLEDNFRIKELLKKEESTADNFNPDAAFMHLKVLRAIYSMGKNVTVEAAPEITEEIDALSKEAFNQETLAEEDFSNGRVEAAAEKMKQYQLDLGQAISQRDTIFEKHIKQLHEQNPSANIVVVRGFEHYVAARKLRSEGYDVTLKWWKPRMRGVKLDLVNILINRILLEKAGNSLAKISDETTKTMLLRSLAASILRPAYAAEREREVLGQTINSIAGRLNYKELGELAQFISKKLTENETMPELNEQMEKPREAVEEAGQTLAGFKDRIPSSESEAKILEAAKNKLRINKTSLKKLEAKKNALIAGYALRWLIDNGKIYETEFSYFPRLNYFISEFEEVANETVIPSNAGHRPASDKEAVDAIIKELQKTPGKNILLIEKAYEFAKEAHKGQIKADGEPLIYHPARVAYILLFELGYQDEGMLAAALLHDVMEKRGITSKKIADEFGNDVATLVEFVSKPDEPSTSLAKDKRLAVTMLDQHAPLNAQVIKFMEKLDRFRDFGKIKDQGYKNRYIKRTIDVFLPFLFSSRLPESMKKKILSELVIYPEILARIPVNMKRSVTTKEYWETISAEEHEPANIKLSLKIARSIPGEFTLEDFLNAHDKEGFPKKFSNGHAITNDSAKKNLDELTALQFVEITKNGKKTLYKCIPAPAASAEKLPPATLTLPITKTHYLMYHKELVSFSELWDMSVNYAPFVEANKVAMAISSGLGKNLFVIEHFAGLNSVHKMQENGGNAYVVDIAGRKVSVERSKRTDAQPDVLSIHHPMKAEGDKIIEIPLQNPWEYKIIGDIIVVYDPVSKQRDIQKLYRITDTGVDDASNLLQTKEYKQMLSGLGFIELIVNSLSFAGGLNIFFPGFSARLMRCANIVAHQIYNAAGLIFGWTTLTTPRSKITKNAGTNILSLANAFAAPQKALLKALGKTSAIRDFEPSLAGVPLFSLQNKIEKATYKNSQNLTSNGLMNVFITPLTTARRDIGEPELTDGPVSLTANGTKFTLKIGSVDLKTSDSPVAIFLDFGDNKVDDSTVTQAESEAIKEIYHNTIIQNILRDRGILVNPRVAPIIASDDNISETNPFVLDPTLSKTVFTENMGNNDVMDYIQMLGTELRKNAIESTTMPSSFSGAWMDLQTVHGVESIKKHIDGLSSVNGDILRLTSFDAFVGDGKRFSVQDIRDIVAYAKIRNIRVIYNYTVSNVDRRWQENIIETVKNCRLFGAEINISQNSAITEPQLTSLKHKIDAIVLTREKDFSLSSYMAITLSQNQQTMSHSLIDSKFEIIKPYFIGQDTLASIADEEGVRYRLVLPGEDSAQTIVINPEAVGKELADIVEKLHKSNFEYNLSLLYGGMKDGQINPLQESGIVDILSKAIKQKLVFCAPKTSEEYFLRGLVRAEKLSRTELSAINSDTQGQIINALRTNSDQSFMQLENVPDLNTILVKVSGDIKNLDEKRGFWSCALGRQMVNDLSSDSITNRFADRTYYPFLGMLLVQAQLSANVPGNTAESARWKRYKEILNTMKTDASSREDVNSQLKTFMSELMYSSMTGTLGTAHSNLGMENYKEITSVLLEFAEPAMPDLKKVASEALSNAADVTIGTQLIESAG